MVKHNSFFSMALHGFRIIVDVVFCRKIFLFFRRRRGPGPSLGPPTPASAACSAGSRWGWHSFSIGRQYGTLCRKLLKTWNIWQFRRGVELSKYFQLFSVILSIFNYFVSLENIHPSSRTGRSGPSRPRPPSQTTWRFWTRGNKHCTAVWRPLTLFKTGQYFTCFCRLADYPIPHFLPLIYTYLSWVSISPHV